jgi:hypothetical protein
MEDQLQLPVLPPPTARVSMGPPGISPPQDRSSSPVQAAAAPAGARSPMPSLVLAAIGVLAGGALLIRAALGLPDDLWGRLDGGGLADVKLVAMAACVSAGGCLAVGRGLVRRGRADRTAVLVCLAVVIPLTGFAAGGAATRPGSVADKRLADPSLPYTFSYPGSWSRDPAEDVPQDPDERWVAAVSKQTNGNVRRGVVVVATNSVSPGALMSWMLNPEQDGAHVAGRRKRTVGGHEALTVAYEREPGRGFSSRTGLFVGDTAFVVTCVLEEDPERAEAGCEKVLASFAFTGEDSAPGAAPSRLN